MIDYQDLGRRIRKAREDIGLSQASLAEKIGYTQSTVAQWESAKRHPSIDDLFRISMATGKPVSWLLDLTDEQGVPLRAERVAEELKAKVDELMRQVTLVNLTPKQEEAVDLIRQLSPEGLEKVLEFGRFLLSQERKGEDGP